MLRLRLFVASFSLVALASCSDGAKPAPITLEGRWNQVSHVEFRYDAQGKLLQRIELPKPTDTPYLIITKTQMEEHANSTVAVFPRHDYTRQQNTLRYPDGTSLEIQELTAETLTLRGPDSVLAIGPLTEPQGKIVPERRYTR